MEHVERCQPSLGGSEKMLLKKSAFKLGPNSQVLVSQA